MSMRCTIFSISIMLIFAVSSHADTIHVPGDQPTIQAGIDAAVDGDTVLVAPGTYVENIDFLGKAITVKSSDGAETTIIDGGDPTDNDFGSVVTFYNGECLDSVLEGFTLTRGTGNTYRLCPEPWTYRGGGIFCSGSSSPTIRDNMIIENSADCGGGIYCYSSSPTIMNNTICDNSATDGIGICCLEGSSPSITTNIITKNRFDMLPGQGGGIYCHSSSPSIANNTISENWAADGGGICCWVGSAPVITDNTISENAVAFNGGGIFCHDGCSPDITDNTIIGNLADYGGGISCFTDCCSVITNNMISGNMASGGGGIYCYYASPDITNNTLTGNSADFDGGGISLSHSSSMCANNIVTDSTASYGGGILCGSSTAVIMNNTIHMNSAAVGGGGVSCWGSASPVIMNNTIAGNSAVEFGGGIDCFNFSSPLITNNTVIGNSVEKYGGGGISCFQSSSATVTNTLLWGNHAPAGPEIWIGTISYPSTLTISYSDVKGGQSSCYVDPGCTLNWGPGMIDSDPLFSDSLNSDFHLTINSPCRGSGDNETQGLPDYDFEGDPRICQGTVDIGADECYRHLYCMGDFTPSGLIEGKLVGLPGTSPVGLFLGSGVLDPPANTMWGNFHLQAPWLLIPLVPIPSNGVLVLPASIPGTPS
ncbi:MAG: right-handed parallel beta-helix repeat-containing protein, partial [Planctomycetota bacterium]